MLQINYQFKNVYLSKEARAFKTRVKMSMPPMDLKGNELFELHIRYHYNFYYKNGNLKKIDSSNFDKLLLDAIAEKLGVDDSQFKIRIVNDFHTNEESCTIVNINAIHS